MPGTMLNPVDISRIIQKFLFIWNSDSGWIVGVRGRF